MLKLIVTVIIVFLIGKWFINNGSQHPSNTRLNRAQPSNFSSNSNNSLRRRNLPEISNDLIQRVQDIAPELHIEQIRYALQKNNKNVQAVVDIYLNGGSFPFPPNYQPNSASNSSSTVNTATNNTTNNSNEPVDVRKISKIIPDNLLTKYNVNDSMVFSPEEERDSHERKQFMIWKARQDWLLQNSK